MAMCSVEPQTSANSTATCLRSGTVYRVGCALIGRWPGAGFLSRDGADSAGSMGGWRAPHSGQNFSPRLLGRPHAQTVIRALASGKRTLQGARRAAQRRPGKSADPPTRRGARTHAFQHKIRRSFLLLPCTSNLHGTALGPVSGRAYSRPPAAGLSLPEIGGRRTPELAERLAEARSAATGDRSRHRMQANASPFFVA